MKERATNLMAYSVGGGALGTLATVGSEIGYRFDKLANPQIYDSLAHHMNWWQLFTTNHSWTVLYLQHEPISAALTFAVPLIAGAGLGLLKGRGR